MGSPGQAETVHELVVRVLMMLHPNVGGGQGSESCPDVAMKLGEWARDGALRHKRPVVVKAIADRAKTPCVKCPPLSPCDDNRCAIYEIIYNDEHRQTLARKGKK
jgi:hypothetical protein